MLCSDWMQLLVKSKDTHVKGMLKTLFTLVKCFNQYVYFFFFNFQVKRSPVVRQLTALCVTSGSLGELI